MVLTYDEVIAVIHRLIADLNSHQIPVDKAILFGSYAHGTTTSDSDIDLAIVSNSFQGNRFQDKQKINPILVSHDHRLEIHPYRSDEFNEDDHWFVKEILDTGHPILL